ncbi:MAG: stage V sporulation protein AB [Lachnospiraceae bacterium]|nr:stage V sporulation protein AB [Lachnospiraceae bacterium]
MMPNWAAQILLGMIGFSGGVAIAGGLFSFIIGLGVISEFADRTRTGDKVLLYEECVALGGIFGNIFFLYRLNIPGGMVLLPIFGLCAGIFVGCWSMALAEILNIFPIFVRRVKILKGIPWLIAGIAFGKGIGAVIFYANRW